MDVNVARSKRHLTNMDLSRTKQCTAPHTENTRKCKSDICNISFPNP